MSEENIRYINPVTGFVDNTTNLIPASSYVPPLTTTLQANWSMVATLNQATLEAIRQIVREEISAALERQESRGLDNLMDSINAEPEPEDEIVAVLATMTQEEWETLVQRVHERKASE